MSKVGFVNVMHQSALRPNGFELITAFIHSLYEHCEAPFHLYLYDNASEEKYAVPDMPNLTYTYIEDQSEGLAKPYNEGTLQAERDGCDVLVLTNDDVVMNETINRFIEAVDSKGLYGPLTNGVLPANKAQRADGPGEGVVEYDGLILNGFCVALTTELYHQVKYPDGNIANPTCKWGGGERDLAQRVRGVGGQLYIVRDCWLFHHKLRGWRKLT